MSSRQNDKMQIKIMEEKVKAIDDKVKCIEDRETRESSGQMTLT